MCRLCWLGNVTTSLPNVYATVTMLLYLCLCATSIMRMQISLPSVGIYDLTLQCGYRSNHRCWPQEHVQRGRRIDADRGDVEKRSKERPFVLLSYVALCASCGDRTHRLKIIHGHRSRFHPFLVVAHSTTPCLCFLNMHAHIVFTN